MNSFTRTQARQQKAGGLAALYLAVSYIVAIPYFVVFVKYQEIVDPAKKVGMLVAHSGSMRSMYLVTYVVFGVVLAVLALALSARWREGDPTLGQTATVAGLMWAGMLVASGMIFNAGMASVVELANGA